MPLRIDGDVPNLGKFAACRRVARTIYLGSAPTASAANRGLEDRRVKLGCVIPGEQPAVFGDALRRLAAAATYLYQDGARYWYSTQPTVTKLAEDRAEQLRRDPDAVVTEIDRRLRVDLKATGDFRRIHPMPQSGADVPDDMDARLVVLGIDHPYSKDPGNKAQLAANAILESRGNSPRLFRNTLTFLAVDQTRLQDLDEAVRRYLAWESIALEKVTLNLDPQQVKQAENQKTSADGAVTARLPESYQWLLVPEQSTPQSAVVWQAYRLSGQDGLAARASKRLRSEELLVAALAGTRLQMELERIPLWRGDHVAVKQLAEDFAKYLYLPRLKDSTVVEGAVQDGQGLLLWATETFAYADSFDEVERRYRGLRCGPQSSGLLSMAGGLVVKPDVALRQLAEAVPAPVTSNGGGVTVSPPGQSRVVGGDKPIAPPAARLQRRFHGTVTLDPTRVGRDAGRIADEVIAHLGGLVGAEITVTLEIAATIPSGATDSVVRTVTENSRTLKFSSHGFEEE